MQNINVKHGSFVRTLNIVHPLIHITLASQFGLEMLSKSRFVMVDGTFQTCEKSLVLTTLIALRESVAVPCAYLLSNSRETHNYEDYYRVRIYTY